MQTTPGIAALFPSTSTGKSHFPRLGRGGELWMLYRLLGDVNALLLVPAWSAAAFSTHLCSLGPVYPMPSRGCNYQKLNGKWISKVQ